MWFFSRRNMFPPNLVGATFQQYKTVLKVPEGVNITHMQVEAANRSELPDYSKFIITGKTIDGINIMGLVVFSIIFGKTSYCRQPPILYFSFLSKSVFCFTGLFFPGITISRLGEKGKPMKHFFESLNEITMSIVGIIMW